MNHVWIDRVDRGNYHLKYGDMVLDMFTTRKKAEERRRQVIAGMEAEINEMVRTGKAYYEIPGDESSLVING